MEPSMRAWLTEFDHEIGLTRRLLERVPAGASDWRPHPRSMSLGELAAHLADVPRWAPSMLRTTGYDMALGRSGPPEPFASREALLVAFDAHASAARQALASASPVELRQPWTLRSGAHEVFTQPRAGVLRRFLFSHLVHHRGQLSVYLRLLGVALPPLYGPSADEAS
jgi:uncharacterized damage-inducible protein DinB